MFANWRYIQNGHAMTLAVPRLSTWKTRFNPMPVHGSGLSDMGTGFSLSAVISYPTLGLGEWSSCVAWSYSSQSSCGKNRIMWMWIFIDCYCLKILTFLYIKHLYIAWVADAASFHSCWVRYQLCLSMCIYIFQHLADCFHIRGMSRK